MKRLVFVIDNLAGGGAERVVLTLASTLNNLGHEGIIVTLSDGQEHSIPDGLNIIQAKEPHSLLGNIGRYRRHAKSLQKLLQEIDRDKKIDLIISNLPRTDRIVKHTHGFKRLFCIHNTYSVEYINNKKGLSRWRKHQQLKNTYRNESLIAVSDGVLEDIKFNLELPIHKICRIYNPFIIQNIQALAKEKPAIDYGDYFIHVGRFDKQKRHDRLLRAFKLSSIPENCKLVLLGNGSKNNTDQIKHLINSLELNDQVILHGFDANPYCYIKNAKALLLSSDFEGLPTVLIESLICNTPVVSTDCPSGPSEILSNDLVHWLVPNDDDQALADKISEIYKKAPIIDEKSYQRFSAETIAQQYLALIN